MEYKGDSIKLQIWDFAGEKRFRFLLPGYIEGANSAFLMYDITSSISFSHLQEWLDVVRQQEGNIPIMLIGSKLDLKKYRSVSKEEGLRVAKQFGLFSFIELSSKSGKNVEMTIEQMTKILLADTNKKETRLELGRFQLNKKMENATEIIRDCISNIAYLANKRNIILNVDLPETFNIELDKVRFEEVVINLLSNAIKNTPPIGVIQISLSKQNGFMVLSVKDSGVGLTRSERGKIFKKFGKIERYGKGLDIIPEGVGLGLFISKEIVENHGGKIFVESKGRNKGANFIVKLPFK